MGKTSGKNWTGHIFAPKKWTGDNNKKFEDGRPHFLTRLFIRPKCFLRRYFFGPSRTGDIFLVIFRENIGEKLDGRYFFLNFPNFSPECANFDIF